MLKEFKYKDTCNGSLLVCKGLDGVIVKVIDKVMSFKQR